MQHDPVLTAYFAFIGKNIFQIDLPKVNKLKFMRYFLYFKTEM